MCDLPDITNFTEEQVDELILEPTGRRDWHYIYSLLIDGKEKMGGQVEVEEDGQLTLVINGGKVVSYSCSCEGDLFD